MNILSSKLELCRTYRSKIFPIKTRFVSNYNIFNSLLQISAQMFSKMINSQLFTKFCPFVSNFVQSSMIWPKFSYHRLSTLIELCLQQNFRNGYTPNFCILSVKVKRYGYFCGLALALDRRIMQNNVTLFQSAFFLHNFVTLKDTLTVYLTAFGSKLVYQNLV